MIFVILPLMIRNNANLKGNRKPNKPTNKEESPNAKDMLQNPKKSWENAWFKYEKCKPAE